MARKYKRLRYEDRQVIEKMSRAGSRVVDIATTLGVHRDTIYKEYARCGATPDTYSAVERRHRHVRRTEKEIR